MRLNRIELKKIMYEYNSLSSRLMQASYIDFNDVLLKFLRYISETEIIWDFISGCGDYDLDLHDTFDAVSRRECLFNLGESTEEEVINVYSILKYISDNGCVISYTVGQAYSTSRDFQDILKEFNDRVTFVLIRHIEVFLTKVGIEMGLDDRITYNITQDNGQVNISNDSSVINAVNNSYLIDMNKLDELIEKLQVEARASGIKKENLEELDGYINTLVDESASPKPKKHVINTALTAIKTIKGTAEFGAAVLSLCDFFQRLFDI